jgi:hypothetical protein
MSSVKKACICSACIALCAVLPLIFHALALGSVFCPMHLPVLLCGLLCGWPYGAFCGVAGPVISCLLTGMPAAAQLVYMVPELCAYGLFSGLLLQRIHTRHVAADLYLALLPAMVLGRLAGGAARAAFYLSAAGSYSAALWVSGYFVETLPGIALQLAVLPPLVLALMKARLVPARYPR